jgi:hypothetical protein
MVHVLLCTTERAVAGCQYFGSSRTMVTTIVLQWTLYDVVSGDTAHRCCGKPSGREKFHTCAMFSNSARQHRNNIIVAQLRSRTILRYGITFLRAATRRDRYRERERNRTLFPGEPQRVSKRQKPKTHFAPCCALFLTPFSSSPCGPFIVPVRFTRKRTGSRVFSERIKRIAIGNLIARVENVRRFVCAHRTEGCARTRTK